MFEKFFQSDRERSTTLLRLSIGIMILPHGLQKTLGWFGGHGFDGTMNHFTDTMGIPYLFALAAILTEVFGGMALITGLGTRLAALGVGIVMLVAGLMHFQNGFFMNWTGQKQGEGFEFHILAIAIAIVVLIKGAGAYSLDQLIHAKLKGASK